MRAVCSGERSKGSHSVPVRLSVSCGVVLLESLFLVFGARKDLLRLRRLLWEFLGVMVARSPAGWGYRVESVPDLAVRSR